MWCNHECGFAAFGDFDTDGRMDLVAGGFPEVWENTGDNQYDRVWSESLPVPNGSDVFSTDDIDGDGRPEFYISCLDYLHGRMYLYMYESNGNDNHQFTRMLVDSLRYWGNDDWGRGSSGGDVDGDGIDECIWTTYDSVRVYKGFGNNDLRKVWDWRNDHHDTSGFNSMTTTVYDVNNDGYNEVIAAGNAKISIFEVDAVDLLSPNGGSCSVGDTVQIRWAVNTPPRCDSLWHFTTIATGLPPDDTVYRWVAPAGVPETARVVVIAYGGLPPLSAEENGGCTQSAWQFDMSDSVITFIGGGVAEEASRVPQQWSLSVSPNPARGAFTVRYDVPGLAGLGTRSELSDNSVMSLGIYDAGGSLVRSLSEGAVAPGRYEARIPSGVLPAGIYFLRLDTPGFRSVKKAVVAR